LIDQGDKQFHEAGKRKARFAAETSNGRFIASVNVNHAAIRIAQSKALNCRAQPRKKRPTRLSGLPVLAEKLRR
jgi:hypothetical protein